MLQPAPICASAENKYVSMGHIARKKLAMLPEDAAKFVDCSKPGHPDIASDPSYGAQLRMYGTEGDYISYMIHQDDVEEFIRRVQLVSSST